MANINIVNISDLDLTNTEVSDLDNLSKSESSEILGGNCQYGGHSYSPGSIIEMSDGNNHTCEDGWLKDYWS